MINFVFMFNYCIIRFFNAAGVLGGSDRIGYTKKSGFRIIGYLFIPFDLGAAVALLVVSEGIGIVEELV